MSKEVNFDSKQGKFEVKDQTILQLLSPSAANDYSFNIKTPLFDKGLEIDEPQDLQAKALTKTISKLYSVGTVGDSSMLTADSIPVRGKNKEFSSSLSYSILAFKSFLSRQRKQPVQRIEPHSAT